MHDAPRGVSSNQDLLHETEVVVLCFDRFEHRSTIETKSTRDVTHRNIEYILLTSLLRNFRTKDVLESPPLMYLDATTMSPRSRL